MAPRSVKLVTLVGSLRRGSLNRVVATAAAELAPPGVEVSEHPLAGVPLFDADVEAVGDPPAVASLKAAVAGADGLVIVTPEYNAGVPAVTKNAVDWLSRPYGSGPLVDKPVGVVVATPGRHDAPGCRRHLADSLGVLTTRLFTPSLAVSSVHRKTDEGVLVDADTRRVLAEWLAAFVEAAVGVG